MNEDKLDGFVLGLLIGFLISCPLFFFTFDFKQISISHETGNKLCEIVTNSAGVIAVEDVDSVWHKKLICEIPSYDSTQNIIIKSNEK